MTAFQKALVVLSLLASCGYGLQAHAETIEKIVAIVNDEIITMTDMNKFADRLKTGGLTDDLLIPDEATKESVLKNRTMLLQKMIEEKVLDSEIKKEGMSVPIERVEQEIRNIAKRNNVTRDELKSALGDRGIAFSAYQDFIKTGLERQGLIEKAINSRIKISEDDVASAYATAHGQVGDQAFEYTLSHIFFSNEKGGAAAAHTRAEAAFKKLRESVSFDKLAGEASEDPAFEQGGALGTFKTGELQKDLEDAVSKLNSGETTNVMQTRDGYQIVKLDKKHLIADPRTEKEREKIRGTLYEKAYKKQFQAWLEQLRQDAFVRINDEQH